MARVFLALQIQQRKETSMDTPDRPHAVSRRTAAFALAGLPFAARANTPAKPDARDLLVGQSAPLSGFMAPTMTGVLAGQQLALDEANRRGGIAGRRVRLELADDAFEPVRTLQNARSFVEDKGAIALFGTVGTAQTAAVLPYVADKRVPLIAAYSGSPALRVQPNPYFFTTQASYADELVKMVRNLVAVRSTRLAIVYQNNEFGQLLLPLAEKVVAAEGATVTASKPLDVNGADAAAVARSLGDSRPQAVIMVVAGPAVVAYVKANRALLGVPVYTFSLSVGSAILKALGDDARGLAVSRATPYPWRATTPLAREFNEVMERAGKPVDYDHFAGYINGRVLVEGLRGAGRNPTPETLVQSMEKLAKLDLGGYQLSYGPNNRHGSSFVEITVVGPNGNFIR
jgi:branched-chain amino acid transport system substrate-binding protein